jgi:hypothetical protein
MHTAHEAARSHGGAVLIATGIEHEPTLSKAADIQNVMTITNATIRF